ncbi:hypothetical protein [Streptomyces sp. NPDC048527]|uniref:hypothetical protein n=1 Tax=Streptomyces sp. NPDC048527 TaxID=3365568 RepID=UPI003720F2CC
MAGAPDQLRWAIEAGTKAERRIDAGTLARTRVLNTLAMAWDLAAERSRRARDLSLAISYSVQAVQAAGHVRGLDSARWLRNLGRLLA